jgi:hypothetical protein
MSRSWTTTHEETTLRAAMADGGGRRSKRGGEEGEDVGLVEVLKDVGPPAGHPTGSGAPNSRQRRRPPSSSGGGSRWRLGAGNPNHPPPHPLYGPRSVGRLGRSRPAPGPQANMGCQQTHSVGLLLQDQKVYYTPSNFCKVQFTSLDLQISPQAFIYLHINLSVLYIYVLDPELFYNSVLSSTL